jgi:hypothetical protein
MELLTKQSTDSTELLALLGQLRDALERFDPCEVPEWVATADEAAFVVNATLNEVECLRATIAYAEACIDACDEAAAEAATADARAMAYELGLAWFEDDLLGVASISHAQMPNLRRRWQEQAAVRVSRLPIRRSGARARSGIRRGRRRRSNARSGCRVRAPDEPSPRRSTSSRGSR